MPANPVSQEGLGYPAQEPLTTPEVEGDPVAQPLEPPDPPTRSYVLAVHGGGTGQWLAPELWGFPPRKAIAAFCGDKR